MESSKVIEYHALMMRAVINNSLSGSETDKLASQIAIVAAMVGQLQEVITSTKGGSNAAIREFVVKLILGKVELRPIYPSNLDSEIERVVDLVTPPHGKN